MRFAISFVPPMLLPNLFKYKIILASKSPRRQQLLTGLELNFEVRTMDVDESFPAELQAEEIPLYLSKIKADAFKAEMADNELIITADTIVWINHHVMNKPESRDEALAMLGELSGSVHKVYTGVSITTKTKELHFFDETEVEFAILSSEELEYYFDKYNPIDKAGSYGVQELIGYIGIKKLNGSYFNVMGLPVHLLYEHLKDF